MMIRILLFLLTFTSVQITAQVKEEDMDDYSFLEGSQIILKLKSKKALFFDPKKYVIIPIGSVIATETKLLKSELEDAERKLSRAKRDLRKAQDELQGAQRAAAIARKERKQQNQGSTRDEYLNQQRRLAAAEEADDDDGPSITNKNRLYGIIGTNLTGKTTITPQPREDGGVTYVITKDPSLLFGLGYSRDLGPIPVQLSYLFPNVFSLGVGIAF